MTNQYGSEVLTQYSLDGSDKAVRIHSYGIPRSEHDAPRDTLPGSIEEIIRDRLSTKRESLHPGCRIR